MTVGTRHKALDAGQAARISDKRIFCAGFLSLVSRIGIWAHIAQSVEHFLGKEEVTGSNPVVGSSLRFIA